MMPSISCAGHPGLMQRIATSSSSLTVSWPQLGHVVGALYTCWSVLASMITLTTSGMMSPAFLMMTLSLMRISFSSIISWLWSEALATVVPSTFTGVSSAVGVMTPVRPTVSSMPSISVTTSSAGNLYATAHLGELTV